MALPSFRAARNMPLPSYRSRSQTDPSSKHRREAGASSASTEPVEPAEDAGDAEDAQELHAAISATIAEAEQQWGAAVQTAREELSLARSARVGWLLEEKERAARISQAEMAIERLRARLERPPERKGTGKGGGGNKQQTQSQRARQLAKKRAALSTAVSV